MQRRLHCFGAFFTVMWMLSAGAQPAAAQEFELPVGAQSLSTRDMPFARYNIPTGPWAAGDVASRLTEGRVLRRTWRVNSSQTTLQVFDPLRSQIQAQGYEILFECHDTKCGGFDFRFAVDVVPAPDMAVDFGDYIFLSAKGSDNEYLTLLVSRFGRANFVQLVEVGVDDASIVVAPKGIPETVGVPPREPASNAASQDLIGRISTDGHGVLVGLEFQSGSTSLAQERYDSLDQLAAFLKEQPQQRVLLVGHTDTVGNLSSNTALSLARAEAVRRQLQQVYGIDATRMQAVGAGFLAPLTSNQDAAGREVNRRVEVVLLPSN